MDILNETDGKRYTCNDLARIACNDCKGCSDCCKGMGNSITLDPYDIWLLTKGLNKSFDELLESYITLSVCDYLILPNIKLLDNGEGACPFLNDLGRCSIHDIRPGFCRLFPLGRLYENSKFEYINQVKACKAPVRTKVKINNWIGIENIAAYEKYILVWHDFLQRIRSEIIKTKDEGLVRNAAIVIINYFYKKQYSEDFYKDFYEVYNKINLIL